MTVPSLLNCITISLSLLLQYITTKGLKRHPAMNSVLLQLDVGKDASEHTKSAQSHTVLMLCTGTITVSCTCHKPRVWSLHFYSLIADWQKKFSQKKKNPNLFKLVTTYFFINKGKVRNCFRTTCLGYHNFYISIHKPCSQLPIIQTLV